MKAIARILFAFLLVLPALAGAGELRGTGSLGIVIERATGSVLIVDTMARGAIGRVAGLALERSGHDDATTDAISVVA